MSVEVSTPIGDVVASTVVEVGIVDTSIVVDTSDSKVAVVIPNSYVLSSSGMYTGSMSTDGIPQWLSDAITAGVLDGTIEYTNLIDNMQTLLNSLSLGINQNITQIENTNLSLAALELSLTSRLYADQATIYDVLSTKVTPTEATAIALSAVSSRFNDNEASILNLSQTRVTASEASALVTAGISSVFGLDASAYVNSRITTYANANLATASSVSLLAAEYNNLSVSITSIEEVYAGMYTQWNGIVTPAIGMFKFVGTTQYQYLGGLLGENNDGWVRTDKSASTTADQAVTWAAGASKLITAPDGSVTGWAFGDGSSTQSAFKIKAQNFSISDGTIGYTPFSISGSNINFNGVVSFSNVTGAPTIPSSVSQLINDSGFTSLATVAAQGYVLPAGVATAINNNTTTINGAKITTGSIYAGQINAASIQAATVTATYINALNVTAASISATTIDGKSITGAYGYFNNTIGTAPLNAVGNGSGSNAAINATNNGASGRAIYAYNDGGGIGVFSRAYNGGTAFYGVDGATGGYFSGSNRGAEGKTTGGWGINGEATSGAGIGVRGYSATHVGVWAEGPVYGFYTPHACWFEGAAYPFTGAHVVFMNTLAEPGDVIEVAYAQGMVIDNAYVEGCVTATVNSTKVFGVYTKVMSDDFIVYLDTNPYTNDIVVTETVTTYVPKLEYAAYVQYLKDNGYYRAGVNAIGEGMINVCSVNGNISNGDYITSSTVPGKGMKQDDDIMHSYTVAKALESVDWSTEPSTTKMISCTYHCG